MRARGLPATLLGLLACGAAVVTCQRPPAATLGAGGAGPGGSVIVVATPASAPPPHASATASGAPAPSAPTSSAPARVEVARVGTRTPGKIQCGAASEVCDTRGQICCIDPPTGLGKCAPKPLTPEDEVTACRAGGQPVRMACDDFSDCPSGQGCCIQDLSSADVTYHVYECAPLPCNVSEVCIPGGPCHSPELACVSDGELMFGDTCTRAEPRASCGAETCRGPTSVCCWDAKARKAHCVASDDACLKPGDDGLPTVEGAAFACSSPADCVGDPCGRSSMMSPVPYYGCASRWAAGDMGWTLLCRTAADCPSYPGRRVTGCKASAELPPFVKACEYEFR
ncbi:MAG: hypothetical protein IT373_33105 [Polyangiaceae bacterium]|nr:hypothetical protein [Polyangiaceae bacterium]